MGDLIKLTTSKGQDIRILENSAVKYKDIGTILLNDRSGARVRAITRNALGNPVVAVRMIYEEWTLEDEDHSWKKLTKCFRDVKLNSLARDIEQHFGLPPPFDQSMLVVQSKAVCNLSTCSFLQLMVKRNHPTRRWKNQVW